MPTDETTTSTPTSEGLPAVPGGTILAGHAPPTGLGTLPQAMEADVSTELADLAPTFGDVLLSIGDGVAQSQDALDRGLVQTAQALNDTRIKVVTDVIQKLNDDGLPTLGETDLVSHDVSLINFVSPTVHEWRRVALSMDLSVGAMDNERGMTFSRRQNRGSASATGLFWGFLGWFSTSSSDRSYSETSFQDREADWAEGQVRLDAMLRPRPMEDFPVPAEVAIGPQIYFSQGSVKETLTDDVLTARSVDLEIVVRKADGSVNPNQNLVVDAGPFMYSFATDGGYSGSTTNPEGKVKVTLTRQIPSPRFIRPTRATFVASLGEVKRSVEITL